MSDSYMDNQIAGVKRWYNLVAEDFQRRYDGVEGDYWRNFEDFVYDHMVDCRNKRVLDLGAGAGRYAFTRAPVASEVFGVDISEEMIRIANLTKDKLEISNIHFSVGDARNLPFSSQYFDVVVSAGMFEYLENANPFLVETERVIKEGGVFVFSCHKKQSTCIAARIYGYFFDILLSRMYSTNASEYVKKAEIRESFYKKAYHQFASLRRQLLNIGFIDISYRSTFYKVPTLLFYWGSRRRLSFLKKAAIRLNLFLGWCPLTKWMGGVMLVKGTKAVAGK